MPAEPPGREQLQGIQLKMPPGERPRVKLQLEEPQKRKLHESRLRRQGLLTELINPGQPEMLPRRWTGLLPRSRRQQRRQLGGQQRERPGKEQLTDRWLPLRREGLQEEKQSELQKTWEQLELQEWKQLELQEWKQLELQ